MSPILHLFPLIAALLVISACKKPTATNTSTDTNQAEAPAGMVYIPGGSFLMGNDKDPGNQSPYPEEAPVHKVKVKPFFMDQTEVTNRQFAEFVKATGYKTFAERGLTLKDFPNANPEDLKAGSIIFSKPDKKIDPHNHADGWAWWKFVPGTNWRHPQGPDSSIEDKMDHPVVCVNYDDAVAYATWAGKRLPTEAEWERAARGGHEQRMYIWGDAPKPNGQWLANTFQGEFPNTMKAEDGFLFSAPVMSFPPNDYGLYDMAGNVWEICSDYYQPSYYQSLAGKITANPKGPESPVTSEEVFQFNTTGTCPPASPGVHPLTHLRSSRGGSFLCHFSYCLRYRPAARHYHEPLTPTHHTGFRCVMDL